jgi:hypothetical protein
LLVDNDLRCDPPGTSTVNHPQSTINRQPSTIDIPSVHPDTLLNDFDELSSAYETPGAAHRALN